MADRKNITEHGGDAVQAFVEEMRRMPSGSEGGGRGRLIFALDATASRKPTWDRACSVQGEMFLEADRLGGLDVQLVFYRGFGECKASRWVGKAIDLVGLMVKVDCRAGRTQIHRVLQHAINETGKRRVNALVFIGDSCEESIDTLGDLAGRLGLLGVKAFVFHEGSDQTAAYAFQEIARLTGCARLPLRRLGTGRASGIAPGGRGLCLGRTEGAHRLCAAGGWRCPSARQQIRGADGLFPARGFHAGHADRARTVVCAGEQHDLAQGARTFIAVFSGLASTGLLFTGRFGLAFITLVAMVMAIKAFRQARRGADPLDGRQEPRRSARDRDRPPAHAARPGDRRRHRCRQERPVRRARSLQPRP
jgi:hypothetical protein